MRKSKVWQLTAAAIAAVPGLALANGEEYSFPTALEHESGVRQVPDLQGGGNSRFRLAPAPVLVGGPDADVDAIWTNDGPSLSWQDAANWSTNPQIPDGNNAIARFGLGSGGPTVQLGAGNITLSQLHYNDPQLSGITGGQLTLTNAAQINATGNNFDLVSTVFTFGTGGNTIGGAGSLTTTVAGSAGLNKTGDGPLQLANANTFSGPVSISGGGRIITTAGDAAFGAAGNAINLNGGTLQVSTNDMVANRTFNIGANGGHIWVVGAGRRLTIDSGSNIAGSGTLVWQSAFGVTASTFPAGTINSNNTHTGTVHINGGTMGLSGSGAFGSSSNFKIEGVMVLGSGNNNRLNDAAPVTMHGGQITAFNQETIGNVTFDGSTQVFAIGTGGALAMGNLTRNNQSTARFLGDALGTGGTTITFAAAPALVGGLIPWAYGSPGNIGFTNPESETNTVVTYGANGVTPVTTLESNQGAWNSTTNALVADAGATISGTVNVNSLVLRVSDFYANNPMTVGGTGTINITTGVILSGNAGFQSNGTTINSTPGNVVEANLNAGSSTFYIHTPSAVSFNGSMHGTGGLVKAGGRTAFFNSQNSTYTGETQLTGFVRYTGNVISGSPGPFGSDTSAIVLYGGGIVPRNLADQAANGTNTAILALDDPQSGPSTFSRPINAVFGSALIRNFSNVANGTMTLSGPISISQGALLRYEGFAPAATDPVVFNNNSYVINSVMSGPGRVEYSGVGATPGTTGLVDATITGANTYTGGTAAAGNLRIAVNSVGTPGNVTSGPFGTGSIQMSAAATFNASGGPRTILNPLFLYLGTPTLGDQLTYGGPIRFVGGDFALGVLSGTGSISGNIGPGGGFFKQGAGSLVLSGDNSQMDGTVNVGNGSTAGGVVVVDSNTALGTTEGPTGVNSDATGGGNVLLLRGNRTIGAETIFLRGQGIGSFAAMQATGGTTNWGGTVSGIVQYANAGTPTVAPQNTFVSVGADAGSSLNIAGSIFARDVGASDGATIVFLAGPVGATKMGAGAVSVGSSTFIATRSDSSTSSFNGSVIATGSLDVQAGTLRIAPSGVGGKSVADVGSVSLGAGAKLDLTNNALVVDYASGGPTPYADIRNKVASGYAGGAWNGDGIMTSNGNASNFALGIAESTQASLTFSGTPADALFLGDVVDQSAILVRFTRYGDANIDGQVNLADFNRLAANFGTGTRWDQGDFDYNGLVNLADFNRLASNFGLSAAGPEVTPDDWARLGAAVPEPSSLALAAVGAAAMLRRRRRA